MDLSKYKSQAENSILEELEPGTYDLQYVSDEEIQGKNGWVALKVLFRVVDKPNYMIGHSFTVDHDTSEGAINIGLTSLDKLAKSCGFPNGMPDDSSELVGSRVRANTIIDGNYLAIDDMKGKGWFPPKSQGVKADEKSEPVSTSESEKDDRIPF
jgi:hypothetical protein